MPAKTPIYLKTTTDKKGKRLKLRDVLSGDMISPPLGDMRHSAHVGPHGEADMFGDVAFLKGKMDMLPSLNGPQNGHGRSQSMDHPQDQAFTLKQEQDYSYNSSHYQQLTPGLLKTTTSLPLFMAQEQAPPKPPRLHLDHQDQLLDSRSTPSRRTVPGINNISLSPTICRLVPSSGSFSGGSSEDSLSDTCRPLDVPRGLSLDFDAGLSNEDLRSERSESPCSPLNPSALTVLPAVSRSDSIIAGLDLDLGPSILDDVLSIMERYKSVEHRCDCKNSV